LAQYHVTFAPEVALRVIIGDIIFLNSPPIRNAHFACRSQRFVAWPIISLSTQLPKLMT
jgi:hypothetical protein